VLTSYFDHGICVSLQAKEADAIEYTTTIEEYTNKIKEYTDEIKEYADKIKQLEVCTQYNMWYRLYMLAMHTKWHGNHRLLH
jgi:hypothetical protein